MTDEQGVYEADLAKLEAYGITPQARAEHVEAMSAAAATDGPLRLHHDPEQSDVTPLMITVNSIQELKDLGGTPDSRFDDGWTDPFEAPPPYADLSRAHQREYSPEMCAARETFLFGDSRRVSDYTDAINETSFPKQVAVFIGKDFTATPDNPLIIPSDGHGDPTAVLYDTITVEPGGQIRWEAATGKLTANLIQFTVDAAAAQTAGVSNFVSQGAKGGDGAKGPDGPKGGDGPAGSPGMDNKNSCKQAASNGVGGTNGVDGGDGTPGANGGNGNAVNVVVDTLDGICNIGSGGGDGGTGGVGGNGGDGGAGGNGGTGTKNCPAGQGKNGGNGGKGGNGGNGGNGGTGGKVTVTYTSGSPTFNSVPITGQGGTAGTAGSGGAGGAGGSPGGTGGSGGANGTSGQAGAAGSPGTVTVNGRTLS